MTIKKNLSIVFTFELFISCIIAILVSLAYFLGWSITTNNFCIYLLILVGIILLDACIYFVYYYVQKDKYIFEKDIILIYDNFKITSVKYCDISFVKAYKLFIDDYDFSSLEIIFFGGEYKIYMPYWKAKKIKKMINELDDRIY